MATKKTFEILMRRDEKSCKLSKNNMARPSTLQEFEK